jgi:hypothetical protein
MRWGCGMNAERVVLRVARRQPLNLRTVSTLRKTSLIIT